MNGIQIHDDPRFNPSRTYTKVVEIAEPESEWHKTFKCKLTLKWFSSVRGKTPLFKVSATNGGMAYPEVLRAYAEMLLMAADKVEGKEPIDFQI